MRVLIWQEANPDVQGGAESWIRDTAAGLRLCGHEAAWTSDTRIERVIDLYHPDALIVGTIQNFIGLQHAARIAGQLPAAWFLHDYWPFCGPRMLMQAHNRSDRSCEAVEGVCANSCGGAHPVPDVLTSGAYHLVTGCKGAAEILRAHGVPVADVVEEGIDTDLFVPGVKRRESVVYASAAWNAPWKGMHVLQQAAAGAGMEVRLLTGMSRQDVARELATVAIFAMPSLYQEIWGLALTEAMSAGCACIASNVAGLRAQIAPHWSGILVPPHDVEALSAALTHLRAKPAMAEAMGTNARAHVAEAHSLRAVGERWSAVLERIREGALCAV